VTNLVRTGSNEVKFLRGKDLNGDGTISSTGELPEGEDYLHPVFAMLTLERPGTASTGQPALSGSGTDFAIGKIEVTNAFNGETATITATLQNLGSRPASTVTVAFLVDGATVATEQVTADASGVQEVSAEWPATAGTHMIGAEVTAEGDKDSSNNAMSRTVTVGALPDLEVAVGGPRSPGASETPQQAAPLPTTVVVIAVVLTLGACRALQGRNKETLMQSASLVFALLLVTACLPVVVPAASASETTNLYLIPVTVRNAGGSDAASFEVTLYLDGEKIATKTYEDGLGAGKEISADIPIHTTPGSHTLKAVVDEAGKIRDGNRGNNVGESTYVFP
jgi:subtilase family serine protease